LRVTICDVGPRDGLQNEQVVLEPPVRAELVDRLAATGLPALEAGATVFEASVGGLGGCPFAPRATGNVATEDLVYFLHGEGVETGVDLDALIAVSEWLEGVLERELPGQVYRAGSFAPAAG
jgi:isopropylmalate/homocitrate/citramalate synthase